VRSAVVLICDVQPGESDTVLYVLLQCDSRGLENWGRTVLGVNSCRILLSSAKSVLFCVKLCYAMLLYHTYTHTYGVLFCPLLPACHERNPHLCHFTSQRSTSSFDCNIQTMTFSIHSTLFPMSNGEKTTRPKFTSTGT
jgi:hypothetical protein